MILLLNGAFGIGKTTVARALARRLPDSLLFDPELIGLSLQRLGRVAGRRVDDFQDLAAWRKLTIGGLRIARLRWRNIIVPMAISNPSYLGELLGGIRRFEQDVRHYCLVAPTAVVHTRLEERGADRVRNAWEFRRAAECCAAHRSSEFDYRIDASVFNPHEIAEALLA